MTQKYFYHVVLGLVHGNRFGAMGLSRRSNLMDKKLDYSSLYDLIMEFEQSYRNCGHRLIKVRVGNLISHDSYRFPDFSLLV